MNSAREEGGWRYAARREAPWLTCPHGLGRGGQLGAEGRAEGPAAPSTAQPAREGCSMPASAVGFDAPCVGLPIVLTKIPPFFLHVWVSGSCLPGAEGVNKELSL